MADTITNALTTATVQADLLEVAGVGLGIGVTLFALRKGYALVKSFI